MGVGRRALTERGERLAASLAGSPYRVGAGPLLAAVASAADGAFLRVLEEGHLELLTQEDFQAVGNPAGEQVEGVNYAPAGLRASFLPRVHLLVVRPVA